MAVRTNGFDDGVGNCASLNLRASGDDRERIRKDRSTADVKGSKGFTFFVERALAYDVDQLADARTSAKARFSARRLADSIKVSRIAASRSRSASSQSAPRSGKRRPGSSESAKYTA